MQTPADRAVTPPVSSTATTALLEEVQVTSRLEAVQGKTEASSCASSFVFSVMVLADSATCSTCSVIWLQPASSCRSKSRTKRATTGSSKKFAGCFWHAAVSGWIWNSLAVLNQSSLSLSYWVQYKRPSLQFHSRDCPVLVATGSTVISSPVHSSMSVYTGFPSSSGVSIASRVKRYRPLSSQLRL